MPYTRYCLLLALLFLFRQQALWSQPPTAANTITPEEFGITGGAIDQTPRLLELFRQAAARQLYIRFTGKTYLFSPRATVDLTGVKGFIGTGTLDMSRAGPAVGNQQLAAVFQVSGTRTRLPVPLAVKAGQRSLSLPPGLNLAAGNRLYLVSAEPLPNTRRPYYYKGQRLLLEGYDAKTGLATIRDSLRHTMAEAFLWVNSYMPGFIVESGLRFVTAPMNFISCFRIYYARVQLSGYYKNFALTALMLKSSEGTVEGMEAELPVTANNGYSHCIQVGDLSEIQIRNCRLSGGRHVISGVGGGLWRLEDIGKSGAAGYPSCLSVEGGVYTGSRGVASIPADIGTVDSHGLIDEMRISNCTIYGGINLGANRVWVTQVTLYTDGKRAFNVGSDVAPGSDWGHYYLSHIRIIAADPYPLLLGKSDIKELVLDDITVTGGQQVLLADMRYLAPGKMTFRRLQIGSMQATPLVLVPFAATIILQDSSLGSGRIKRLYGR